MLRMQCPHCSAKLLAPKHRAGAVTRCLVCDNAMTVPCTDGVAAPPPPGEADPTNADQVGLRLPVSRLAIASSVFAVGAVLAFAASCMFGGASYDLFLALYGTGVLFGFMAATSGGFALERTRGSTPRRRGRDIAIGGMMLGILCAIVPIIFPPGHDPEHTYRRVCTRNMKQIGTAMYTYAGHHDDPFPPKIGLLVLDGSIDAGILKCPSSHSPNPSEMTIEEAAEWANTRGDYVYIWPPEGRDVAPNDVLMYERLGQHGRGEDDGINILHGDSGVQWYLFDDAEQILREQGIDPVYADH